MEDIKVIDFIHRRFPVDNKWLNGNCFYFAAILKARFPKGQIFYDVIRGHFIFKYNNEFYDYSGLAQYEKPILWEDILNGKYDNEVKDRIIKGCIE